MPKFEEKSLPRGVKLYGDEATTTQTNVATSLSSKGIDKENFVRPSIPWRITFNPTVFKSESFTIQNAALPFLFTLVPPQELFDSEGQQAYDQVELTLEEISISFDTRQEPAAIGQDTGFYYGYLEAYKNIEITIVEKQQWYFNPTMETHLPEKVLFSRKLPEGVEFASMDFPLAQADLGIQLSPYKTYALQFSTDFLAAYNETSVYFCLPNPVFSLKGKWTRLPNTEITTDPGDDDPELQNGPQRATSDANDTVTITVPGGGTNIDATVLNTNLTTLDNKLFEGIQGGYGPNSEMGAYGHTLETMGYDIIAVPLFNSSRYSALRVAQVAPPDTWEDIQNGPYFQPHVPPLSNSVYDRFVLPVAFPMEVHHVYCGWSLIDPPVVGTPVVGGQHPTGLTTRWQVGVSMGSGVKSDWNAYQQIAALEFGVDPGDPTYYQNFLIDRYRVKDLGFEQMSSGGPVTPKWDVALLSVPLMKRDGGPNAPGYYPQGTPMFVGRGNSWTGGEDQAALPGTISRNRRSTAPQYSPLNNPPNVGVSWGTPPTKGLENFIEVAVKIEDINGLENNNPLEVFTGHGGFWVYLVVKRAGVASVERLR
jgi:hypothetical protein